MKYSAVSRILLVRSLNNEATFFILHSRLLRTIDTPRSSKNVAGPRVATTQ
jgi:phage-related protein